MKKKKTSEKRAVTRRAVSDLDVRKPQSVKGGLAASQLNNASTFSRTGSSSGSGETAAP